MVYSLNLVVIRFCTSCILLVLLAVRLICTAAHVDVRVPQIITTVYPHLFLPHQSHVRLWLKCCLLWAWTLQPLGNILRLNLLAFCFCSLHYKLVSLS